MASIFARAGDAVAAPENSALSGPLGPPETRSSSTTRVLFAYPARLAVGKEGRWAYGDGQEHCVSLARWGSRRVVRACREWERQPVEDGILRPGWNDLRERAPISERREEALSAAFLNQDPSPTFPSYDRIWFAESGDLWVRTIGPDRAHLHPYLEAQFVELRPPTFSWDVFDEAGELKMTVQLPSSFDPQLILEGLAFGLVETAIGDYALARVSW